MMLSFAIACSSRGAPVRLCKPAPQVEKKDPITMTHGEGHERVPTTKFLFTASPYLRRGTARHSYSKEYFDTHVWFSGSVLRYHLNTI